jgi:2-enoate reductase
MVYGEVTIDYEDKEEGGPVMKLFEKGRIGSLSLKNRIVMDAMNIQLATPNEEAALSQRAIDFYVARAKGGAGLIKTTFMRPSRKLEFSIGEPVVNSERCVSWLNDLAEAVHDYGAKICIQLSPGLGRIPVPKPSLPHGGLVGPSPLPSFRDPDGQMPRLGPGRYPAQGEKHVTTRELTTAEIEELVKDFEYSSRIIRLADIDAIEIHGHQGYLLDQFMTALWNKRTDKYGGDLDGRLKLALELVEAIRRGAGPEFPILFKYPLTHYLEGGRNVEEGLEIARRLEAAGVDALTINAGCYETYNRAQPPTTQPRGCNVDLAAMAKKVVSIPVIVSGKLGYPDLAEQVLQEGKADFIALARYLLADPDWPNKVKNGRTEDIIPCLGCHEGCIARVRKYQHISCAVNPATGVEKTLAINPSAKKKSVLVIGGGPAGMEAARVSALRGHQVTLWEKQNELGGNLIPASIPDFKDDYKLLTDYLSTQIRKLGVIVELEKEATPQLIQKFSPEVVFVATGATPIIPEIDGIEEAMRSGRVLTAVDLLLGKIGPWKSVVLIGGGLIGCETALYLAKKGKHVTIVEILDSVARDMAWGNALDLIKLLDDYKIKILTNSHVQRITEDGICLINGHGEGSAPKADIIILAVGMKSSSSRIPVDILEKIVPEVYAIGDCAQPRRVLNAFWEGYRTARLI